MGARRLLLVGGIVLIVVCMIFGDVFAVFDTMLISGVVFLFGSPVLALIYILAIVPYSFDRGPSLGYVTAGFSVLGFLVASYGYAVVRPADAAPTAQVACTSQSAA